jgi:hypothetical protein
MKKRKHARKLTPAEKRAEAKRRLAERLTESGEGLVVEKADGTRWHVEDGKLRQLR